MRCNGAYLESVLARKGLAAKVAGKRLDSQVNALVTLQVVVAAKRLDALVALEGALRLRRRRRVVSVVHHLAAVALVVVAHAGNNRHLTAGLVHVGHDGTAHVDGLTIRLIRGAVAVHVAGERAHAAGARAGDRGRRLGGRVLLRRIRGKLRRARRGVVAGVAAGAAVGDVGVGIRVIAERRLHGGLRRGHDGLVVRSRRGHGVGVVGAVVLRLVKGRVRLEDIGGAGSGVEQVVGAAVHGPAAIGRERLLSLRQTVLVALGVVALNRTGRTLGRLLGITSVGVVAIVVAVGVVGVAGVVAPRAAAGHAAAKVVIRHARVVV